MSKALKSHAQNQLASKMDAKSILLVDKSGSIQEPTDKTLSLLGVHTSAKRIQQNAQRKTESTVEKSLSIVEKNAHNAASHGHEDEEVKAQTEDQINLLGFTRPNKRFRPEISPNGHD